MFNRIFLISVLILLNSCIEKDKKIVKQLNPNGDSELALLMRELYDQTLIIKSEIVNSNINFNNLEKFKYFDNLLKNRIYLDQASPTDKSLKKTNTYSDFTKKYNYSVAKFIDNKNISKESYNNMINECILCHNQFCLGAIKKIQTLRIND